MAQLIVAKDFLDGFADLPKSAQQQVRKMIDLFQADPNHPSLHREHYAGLQADPRAQTIRVNLSLRAIILKTGTDEQFILIGVLPHDKADFWMAHTRASVNNLTGALELCNVTTVAEAADAIANPAGVAVDLFHGARDKDFVNLGVDGQFIPCLRKASTRTELATIIALLPDLQGDAVEMLADGISVEEANGLILEAIDALAPVVVPDPDDLVAAAARPASSTRFHVITSDADLDDILSQPLEQWRVFLHPSQRRLAERAFKGPARVTGGPGTGKTVVALHRARNLAKRYPNHKILLTTFTSTLATNLVAQLRSLAGSETDGHVEITNIDKLAMRLVRETSPKASTTPATDQELNALFVDACNETGIAFHPSFVRQEWEQIVLAVPVDSRDAYFKVARAGRGVRLNRKQRADVWEVIELVTGRLSRKGKRTFIQIASDAAESVVASGRSRFDHILVDEGQDLHPAHWRLLRALVPHGADDLFVVGDAQQRIYDRKVVLSRVGIDVKGRSSVLRLNYRSTAEIVRWAIAVLGGQAADDLDDGSEDRRAYRSVLRGAPPTLDGFTSTNAELERVVSNVRNLLASGERADEIILAARENESASTVANRLTDAGIANRVLGDDAAGEPDAVHCATFHRLKGLEYRHVFLIDVSEGTVPLARVLTSAAEDPQQNNEDVARERSLLFVAATRARDSLHVSYHGKPSPFLPKKE